MGFAVHVPHYLAQATFPEAALSLTRSINAATGLAVPLEPLEKASASNLEDIAAEMQTSQEVQELVATLEQQYDALQAEHQGVPSADDIAAEFEKLPRRAREGRVGPPRARSEGVGSLRGLVRCVGSGRA